MTTTFNKSTLGALLIWSPWLLVASSAVSAQETAQAPSSGASLDEVVVTARRRVESVQDTPVSVSAFDSRALADRNVQSSAEIANFVPNVQFDSVASESGGASSSQIAIRGIGQTDYVITVEPGVGIYLDGVYVGKSVGSLLDTADIARMEVLRGPQGTLFGKNTIGGAIQLVSKRPSNTWTFNDTLTTGSFDRFDATFALSGPISDAVRMRLSGLYQSRDGFMKRVTPEGVPTGAHQGNMNRLGGRFVLEADLTSNLLATLALDGTRIREQSPAQILLRAREDSGFAPFYNAAIPGGVCLPSAGPSRFTNPYCYNSQYVQPVDSATTTNSGGNQSDTDVLGTSLTLDWNLGSAKLRSISAYRGVNAWVSQDLYASPYYFNNVGQSINQKQFSQEFQLSGDALGSRLKYLGGAYYLNENGTQRFPVNLTLVQFLSGGQIRNDSYALFGQLTYEMTDKWSVTAGLRETREERKFNPGLQHIVSYDYYATTPVPGFQNPLVDAFGPPGTPLFPAGWYKRVDKALTPMGSLSYKIDRDVMVYATISKGFKGGGFTMRYFPAVIPPPGTDPDSLISYAGPEKATSYEVGIKSELWQRRLRLNVAGFYTDYRDIQTTYVIPGVLDVPVLANAGDAKIKGVELEVQAAVSEWLRLDGSMGYLDGKYTHFSDAARATFPGIYSFKLPNTPKITFNVGGEITFLHGDRGTLFLRADLSHRGGEYKDFSNTPELYQKNYNLLSANLTYKTSNDHWQVSLGGTNLTDVAYMVSGQASSDYAQAVRSRPREWYLQLRNAF